MNSKWYLILFQLAVCSTAYGAVTPVTTEQFEFLPKNWTIGAQQGGQVGINTDTEQNHANSAGSLKASYPAATGASYAWATYKVAAYNTYELNIEFWAKMPQGKHGLKFLKIFGGNAGGDTKNYANTTFGLDYTGLDNGGMTHVSFGDGSKTANDTSHVISLDGTNPALIGRSYGIAKVDTPQNSRWSSSNWGTTWHHFKFYVKFNSGTSPDTEQADGAYRVEIDGKLYVDASQLFNRHYTNMPIDRIELLGWSQSGTEPFEIGYDDVKISIGRPGPMPPGDLILYWQ